MERPEYRQLVHDDVNSSSGATAFTATYDAWNRLVNLIDPESGGVIQRNTYDARRFRIVREDLGEAPRHFYYTTGWQCLEERASTSPESAAPDRQFTWGLRYIDDLILRDRDTDTNGSLNERHYACQDANWNVTTLASSAGSVAERYAYSAYGVPIVLTPTFTDRAASLYEVEHLYCGLVCSPKVDPRVKRVSTAPDGQGETRCRSDGSGIVPSRW